MAKCICIRTWVHFGTSLLMCFSINKYFQLSTSTLKHITWWKIFKWGNCSEWKVKKNLSSIQKKLTQNVNINICWRPASNLQLLLLFVHGIEILLGTAENGPKCGFCLHERWTYALLWFVLHENCYSTKEPLHSMHSPKLSTSPAHSKWISIVIAMENFSDKNRF